MPSLIEIEKQIAALQLQAEEIRACERSQTVQEILLKMDAVGITVADLERAKGRTRKSAPAGKSSSPAPIKYRGPNGETWTGRGLMPRWLSTLVSEGQTKELFAV